MRLHHAIQRPGMEYPRAANLCLDACMILVLGAAMLVIDSAAAAPLTIGPVALGMSNAEVTGVAPLKDCYPLWKNEMHCSSVLATSFGNKQVSLTFTRTSKRLTKAAVYLYDWKPDDNRLGRLFQELKIRPCPAAMRGPRPHLDVTEVCYEAPNQIRWLRKFDGQLGRRLLSLHGVSLEIMSGAPEYADRLRDQREKALAQAQLAIRQKESRKFEQGH